MDDRPGVLTELLAMIAEYEANILTIHQSIPLNGVATVTLSLEVLSSTGNMEDMIEALDGREGVHYLKIAGRE